jgi:hypothetical protein
MAKAALLLIGALIGSEDARAQQWKTSGPVCAGPAAIPSLAGPADRIADAILKRATEAKECMRPVVYSVNINGELYDAFLGRMSKGYFLGMSLTYLKTRCDAVPPLPGMKPAQSARLAIVNQPIRARNGDDSLAWLLGDPKKLPSQDPGVLTHATLMTLGRIESKGAYNEGLYLGDYFLAPDEAEAGLFQNSFNSVKNFKLGPVYNELLEEHFLNRTTPPQPSPANIVLKEIFGVGQELSENFESWGHPAKPGEADTGYGFQEVSKDPAFAVEYAAPLIRRTAKHHGPIIRKEARPRNECIRVLDELRTLIDSDPSICRAIGPELWKQFLSGKVAGQLDWEVNEEPVRVSGNLTDKGLKFPRVDVLRFVIPEIKEILRKLRKGSPQSANLELAARVESLLSSMSDRMNPIKAKAPLEPYVAWVDRIRQTAADASSRADSELAQALGAKLAKAASILGNSTALKEKKLNLEAKLAKLNASVAKVPAGPWTRISQAERASKEAEIREWAAADEELNRPPEAIAP